MRIFYKGNALIKAHDSDLGFDLVCAEDTSIQPKRLAVISTGTYVIFPSNVGGLVKDRSSLASRGLFIHGGVIDPGYTGEIRVVMYNSTDDIIKFSKGDRIAQLLLFPLLNASAEPLSPEQFDLLAKEKDRQNKGFGSTGV